MPVRLWDLIVKHSRSTKGPYHPVTDIHLGSVLTNVSVPNGGWFKYFIQYSRSLYIWYKAHWKCVTSEEWYPTR